MTDLSSVALRDDPDALAALIPAWRLSLRAANKSPRTVKNYLDAAEQLTAYLSAAGMPQTASGVRREHVEAFIVHLTETRSASTAATRYRGLQQFFRWLLEEGEIPASPMAKMSPPAVEEAPVPVLSPEDRKALLGACSGRDFDARRDMALLSTLLDCGLRREEAATMTVDDVVLESGRIIVHGKGRRERHISIGRTLAAALSRYELSRRRHKRANLTAYWLGIRGPITGSGIAQILRRRCKLAGIEPVHPHVLRHTWAHSMLALDHTEGDLRVLGGWRTRDMLDRYGASMASERAQDAHRSRSPLDSLAGQ